MRTKAHLAMLPSILYNSLLEYRSITAWLLVFPFSFSQTLEEENQNILHRLEVEGVPGGASTLWRNQWMAEQKHPLPKESLGLQVFPVPTALLFLSFSFSESPWQRQKAFLLLDLLQILLRCFQAPAPEDPPPSPGDRRKTKRLSR